MELLLKSIDALQESFEYVCLGSSLFGYGICGQPSVPIVVGRIGAGKLDHTIDTRAGKDLAGLTGGACSIAFDLRKQSAKFEAAS